MRPRKEKAGAGDAGLIWQRKSRGNRGAQTDSSAPRLLRFFYLSLLSKAVGTLGRIYFFDKAGDYVARVGVIQLNFVTSEYDYAKKGGRACVARKVQLDSCCTIRVDVVGPSEVSGYRCPA